MKNQSQAYLYALITVFLWSTVATAFKIALRDLNSIELLVISNLTSLLVFFIILLIQGKWQLLKNENASGLGKSALQGLFNPFVYYLLVFGAYSLLPAQVAQPANFIWPVVLMVLSVLLLKQPLRINIVAALLISFAGIIVLSSQGNLTGFKIIEPWGIGFALLSSLIWSLFWIFNMKDSRDDVIKFFLSFLFASIYILVLAVITGNLITIFYKPWYAAVYIGLFEMGITFVFWLKALKLSESTGKISNFIYLTPFVSLIFIHFILHEKLHFTSAIGLCLIVTGIIVGRIKKRPV